MEGARNLNFCRTNGGGASELAVAVDCEVVETNCMKNNIN